MEELVFACVASQINKVDDLYSLEMSNNEKEKTPFNAQKSLREVHLSTLAGQSNIYCSCLIPSKDDGSRRAERILVSTLSKNFRIYSASSNDVEYQEKMYAYLPQGCEIISIDLFRDDESDISAGKNLITGVTWSSAPNSESISSYFLNTYESNLNYDTLTCISSIEFLDWIPFQITHCKLNSSVSFVVSGSDCRIHMFKKDLSSREYSESTTSELEADLPEFAQPLDSVALWVAFQYLQSTRITAIAQECGKLLVFIINTDDNSRVVQKHTFGPLEGPLTKVSFFRDSANLVVVFALVPSRVFYNVIEHGLEKSSILPLSDEFDVPTCCTLADIVSVLPTLLKENAHF